MQDAVNDAIKAFTKAVEEGRLNRNPGTLNYVGDYMYMGPTIDGKHDAFKNIVTRQYLPIKGGE